MKYARNSSKASYFNYSQLFTFAIMNSTKLIVEKFILCVLYENPNFIINRVFELIKCVCWVHCSFSEVEINVLIKFAKQISKLIPRKNRKLSD